MQACINPTKRLLFNALGLAISVIPVTVAIFSYFPLWIEREDASLISGISLLLAGLALVPMFKYVKRILSCASAPIMWLVVFVIFFCLSRIADEVTVISFVGFTTNLISAAMFKIAQRCGRENGNEGQS